MIASFILGGIVGLLLGVLICYWKQIHEVYENKDKISSGIDAFNAVNDFIHKL